MLFASCLALLVAAATAQTCKVACHMNYLPLCGSDGLTYGNKCQLDAHNCLTKAAVAVQYAGACKKAEPVAACKVGCPMNYLPVCGTDGLTYGNKCQLDAQACQTKSSLAVQYEGACKKVEPAQTCNAACQMNYLPVCGTDGLTYGNKCQLDAHNCLTKSAVAIQYEGACQACKVSCQFNYSPVCGTDGVTYGNKCQLESQACLKKTAVTVAHEGSCVVHARLVPFAPKQECKVACLRNYEPVCGTDGSTYANACMLESFACVKRLNIAMAHKGAC